MHDYIEVEFRSGRIGYYLHPESFSVKPEDLVLVDVERGEDIAQIMHLSIVNEELDNQCSNLKVTPIKRLATDEDKRKILQLTEDEARATEIFMETLAKYPFTMKLIETIYQFDGNKLTFFFTADGRIDFRLFVRELANIFKTRIELHQTTGRDEAKRLGGFGMCGINYCCGSFLKRFNQVTIKMAKDQNLAGNLSKISGPCGRLLCCLNFEEDFYLEQGKEYPLIGTCVKYMDKEMFVFKIDILNKMVFIVSEEQEMYECSLEDFNRLPVIDTPVVE